MERSRRVSSSAAQPASKKQPAASVEASSSAAQPASKKRALDIDPSGGASGSAAQPASKKMALDIDPSGGASGSAARPATLLEQVEQLGHYPKRCKKPVTDKERTENSLADKISKQWSQLTDTTRAELTRLRQPATLLEQVEQLGHYPKRFEKPATDKERTENSLADKISKQWSQLTDTTRA